MQALGDFGQLCKKEGHQEGHQEGRMEGRMEERKKMAVEMLRKGYSMAAITDLTGFSEEEIRSLAQESAH